MSDKVDNVVTPGNDTDVEPGKITQFRRLWLLCLEESSMFVPEIVIIYSLCKWVEIIPQSLAWRWLVISWGLMSWWSRLWWNMAHNKLNQFGSWSTKLFNFWQLRLETIQLVLSSGWHRFKCWELKQSLAGDVWSGKWFYYRKSNFKSTESP